jgi:two-component system phosphate regulon sensor histidine kinase PhoR
MKLTKRTIGILIGFILGSLAGVIGLQVYLLKDAYDQRDAAFRQSVGIALAGVNDGLERGDALARVFALGKKQKGTMKTMVAVSSEICSDSAGARRHLDTMVIGQSMPLQVVGGNVSYAVTKPQRVALRVFDLLGREDTTIVDSFVQPGSYSVALNAGKYGKGNFYYRYTADSSTVTVRVVHGEPGGAVTHGTLNDGTVEDVVSQLVTSGRLPAEKRIEPAMLDSLLTLNLRESGIDMPHAYGILALKADSLTLVSSGEYARELKASEFRARLFPGDLFASANDLVLYFPNHTFFLLRSMAPLLGATVLFSGGIIFAFIFTMKTIVRQKRLSEALIDFINNMTHEFKTPLSTIALASEAIARPDVLTDNEKVSQYNGIILDENARMKQQVDKILQMAVLEEGDYELKSEVLDAHEIIRKSVEAFRLQIDRRGGRLDCSFAARDARVAADPLHLTNMINNLLDNANKYSPDIPVIHVQTESNETLLRISIRDEGMGMKPEDARRACDRYFRVPKGNRHDVKGFGLGLTYVKMMAEAQHGSVALESTPGVGTRVTVSFPLASPRRGERT